MNWGKGITIAIVLFIGFIVSFVVKAFNHDVDLVRTDYYEHELNYDIHVEKENNYNALKDKIEISKTEAGVVISFPQAQQSLSGGTISFYRPQSKKYDRAYAIALDDEGKQILPYEDFFEGFYEITIDWTTDAKGYIFKQDISF